MVSINFRGLPCRSHHIRGGEDYKLDYAGKLYHFALDFARRHIGLNELVAACEGERERLNSQNQHFNFDSALNVRVAAPVSQGLEVLQFGVCSARCIDKLGRADVKPVIRALAPYLEFATLPSGLAAQTTRSERMRAVRTTSTRAV